MCLGAPTSPHLAALSPIRFGHGCLIWRRIILRPLVTHDPSGLIYAKPQLEMAAERKYPLMRSRSGVRVSRGSGITQTLGRAARTIPSGLAMRSRPRVNP